MTSTTTNNKAKSDWKIRLLDSNDSLISAEVLSVNGHSSLNQLYQFQIVVRPEAHEPLLLEHLQASRISLVVVKDDLEINRFSGILSSITTSFPPEDSDAWEYTLHLVPEAWLLTQVYQQEIFLDKSFDEIVVEKLERLGWKAGREYRLELNEKYPTREFVVQYQESDWSFLNRWLEYYGITYHFDQQDGREVLVIADQTSVFERHPTGGELVFDSHEGSDDVLHASQTTQFVPQQVKVKDYNYRSPGVALLAKSGKPSTNVSQHVVYGDHFKTPDEAEHHALLRYQELSCKQDILHLQTKRMELRSGQLFDLVLQTTNDSSYLITDIELVYHHDSGKLINKVKAIPEKVRFRPSRVTPRPTITGLLHAQVDGAIRGDYAEIDEQGRYKVRFGYDWSGRSDLQASRPVRMLQPHAGSNYGMHFPLRPHAEVLIGFVEGDPDRPLIVGSIPNPHQRSPVQAGNLTENVLRTGSNNEVVMQDAHGEERVRVHSPLYNTTVQLGSQQEPEMGYLVRTDANASTAANSSINMASPRVHSISDNLTQICGTNHLLLVGVNGVKDSFDHEGDRLSNLIKGTDDQVEQLSLLEKSKSDETVEERMPSGNETWSGVSKSLSDRAWQESQITVDRISKKSDSISLDSDSRTPGLPCSPMHDSLLIHGSGGSATLFAKNKVHLFSEKVSVLSSLDTARIVAKNRVDIQSPEEIEIAGKRIVRITSNKLVDTQTSKFSVVAGGKPEVRHKQLPKEVSIAMVGEHNVHIKSQTGNWVACAEKNMILHAHQEGIKIVAKKGISIQGSSIHGIAGDIIVDGSTVRVKGASGVFLESGSVVCIEAPTIVLTGNVEITGNLHVAGTSALDGHVTCGDGLDV
jgi:type VI secretion system VgrG family protein